MGVAVVEVLDRERCLQPVNQQSIRDTEFERERIAFARSWGVT